MSDALHAEKRRANRVRLDRARRLLAEHPWKRLRWHLLAGVLWGLGGVGYAWLMAPDMLDLGFWLVAMAIPTGIAAASAWLDRVRARKLLNRAMSHPLATPDDSTFADDTPPKGRAD